jgi:hypothetical protein
MEWILDLLTTYTHHSQLKVITALSLISTLYKSPQQPLCLFQPAALRSRSLSTASNNGDSSDSRVRVPLPQCPVRNSTLNCQLRDSQSNSLLKLPTISLPSLLNYSQLAWGPLWADPTENTVPLLSRECSFPRERAYRAVAYKWPFDSPIAQQRLYMLPC